MSSEAQTDERDVEFTRSQIYILLAITVFAAALRLFRLDAWAVWVDEAHSFRDVTLTLDEFWNSHVSKYPLSYLLLRALLEVFPSNGEGWLRLPFAFFGILSVPALALVGRGIVGARAALWGALLLCVCPWHIYWSQNVRSYAMVGFFGLLAAAACYHAVRRRRLRDVLWFVLASVLAGFSHPSGFLLFASLLIYAALALRSEGFTIPPRIQVAVICLMIVLGLILWANIDYFSRAKPDASLLHLTQTTVFFLRIPLILAGIGGALMLWPKERGVALFLSSWAVIPIVLLAGLGSTLFKTTAQYGFSTLPGFCLLGGVLALRITEHLTRPGWQTVVLRLCVPAILVFDMLAYDVLYFTRQHGDRPRWREAADYVASRSTTEKWILTTNEPGLRYYFLRQNYWGTHDDTYRVISIETWNIKEVGSGAEYVERMRKEAGKARAELWVVLTDPELREKDRDRSLDTWLRAHGHQRQRFENWTGPKDMTVLVYEVPTAGP